MGLKEIAVYGTIFVGGLAMGNRVEHYVHTIPTEKKASFLESELGNCKAELKKYTLQLSNGKEATLNPDMSVTISGIDGSSTEDIDSQEFRKWKK